MVLKAHKKTTLPTLHGTLLPDARPIPAFSLTGIDEKEFTATNLKGQWTLLFFGFTHCPSLCPTTMQALAGMMEQLQATHFSPLPRVVLISVDPNRDNLITLAQFVHTFNPDFYAARGNLVSTSQLAKQFGIGLEISHTIEHTGTILVINPEGQLAAFLTTPHHAENLAQDYRQILMQTSYHASQGTRT